MDDRSSRRQAPGRFIHRVKLKGFIDYFRIRNKIGRFQQVTRMGGRSGIDSPAKKNLLCVWAQEIMVID